MDRIKQWLGAAVVTLGISSYGFAMGVEVVNTENVNLNIGGRIQEIAYGQEVDDPYRDDGRVYLFLSQARLRLFGNVYGTKFDTQWVGAAEDINGSNNGLTLLDFWFDVPLFNWQGTWLRVGQFKVPYSRQAVTEEGLFQFVSPSIDFLGFNLGRDVGAAIHTYAGPFAGVLAVQTGGSRDVPLRFLPEQLGVPMTTLRIGLNNGVDPDIFSVSQNDLSPRRLATAAYINGLYMKDTRIGHNVVLNLRTSDRTLLTNGNWNPFLNRAPSDRGELWQIGGDVAIRAPVGGMAWSGEAEYNYGAYTNEYGKLELAGVRVQTGLLIKKFEVALRYAGLFPDKDFHNRGTAAPFRDVEITDQPFHEVGPVFNYYIRGHDHKISLAFPYLIDVPVFIENGVGAYVSTEQVDQASLLSASAANRVERQDIPEFRLMYQLAF